MEVCSKSVRYRKDYSAAFFQIGRIDLTFYLDPVKTRVVNKMQVTSAENKPTNEPLILEGVHLSLIRVELNGQPLVEQIDYEVKPEQLIIFNPPEVFGLTIETFINPSENTALEGLYLANQVYCTQCEAEGFRKITYYLDRPDILAEFYTKIYAPVQSEHAYPYLLSNGNLIDSGVDETGRSWALWHDPHPKPSYLFAVVAGDFATLEDTYLTAENRTVQLTLFVEKNQRAKAQFAMKSLIRAMAWDEARFGLSYDLDAYMIVAVDFFNMGAMENKGLNIFNSKYVLAEPATATDLDYINIEAVIGHEYFHNWTGNRVTCRDWFQLSLKEGLTVFREQEFTADQGMRAVKRIEDVKIIRGQQFDEDCSPMAHPIRPEQVMEMNNFYTVTIYNKGAEVVRMLHTLLGETGFKQGLHHYLTTFDGKAATCEDFLQSMEIANGCELNQFRRWYSQAGTPELKITTQYKRYGGKFTVTVEQLSDQPCNAPFHIPLKVEFLNNRGEQIYPDELAGKNLLEITEPVQTFVFNGFKHRPVFAPLADFSAPVKMTIDQAFEDLLLISKSAQDAFLRWDAIQQVYLQLCQTAIQEEIPVVLPEQLVSALKEILLQPDEPSLLALMLQIPHESVLANTYEMMPVNEIIRVINELKEQLSEKLFNELLHTYQNLIKTNNYQKKDAQAIAERMLINTCLQLLAVNQDDLSVEQAIYEQFEILNNMTLQHGALSAAVTNQHPVADLLLDKFAQQWITEPLVMDKWFAIQAVNPTENTVERVKKLVKHEAYQPQNPNRIYALWASFSRNFTALHRSDGSGYIALISTIKKLNAQNPQVASRLITPLLQWQRLPEPQQSKLHVLLLNLRELEGLSTDLIEKIDLAL